MTDEERAGLPEVARLMARLCEIPSPSRDEGAVAEVVRAELRALGAELSEDDAAAALPAGCGNIVARFAPTAEGGTPIMLAAHLDTVPAVAPIEVTLVDGQLTNRNAAILGGDDKSAVAALIVAMRRVRDEGIPHAGVELVMTPCEEIGLRGAAHFDPSTLRARMGFVFDHTGELGGIVGSAPSLRRLEATFVGRPAHAGIVPEDGRSAIEAAARAVARMPLGRIDAETTANIGTIAGGTATNVVPSAARSPPSAAAAASARWPRSSRRCSTRSPGRRARARSTWRRWCEEEFTGYRLTERDPQVALAMRALSACGYAPRLVPTGGGSDVNAFLRNGFPAVNLCNGDDRHPHRPRSASRSPPWRASSTSRSALIAGARAA